MTGARLPALLIALVLAVPAAAQELPERDPLERDPLESMPIRFGPLGLSPSLLISDVGIDDNVFNSETDPQRDFTATIVPRLVARLRARRLLLTYRSSSDFVYYQDFTNERSINNTSNLRLELVFGRLQPFVMGGLQSTRSRLNSEIDIRAHRENWSASAGTRLLVAPRTALSVAVRQSETEFDPGVFFEGAELAKTLNSRQEAVDGGLHLMLTPLTTLEIGAGVQQDRFPGAPGRDAESFRLAPTLHFSPGALFRGKLTAGFRRFRPLGPELPDYAGPYAEIALSATLLGRTKFDWSLLRDVQYSFEERSPYYVETGSRIAITHHVIGRFDVQGTGGRQRLDYRTPVTLGTDRVDHVDIIGAGIGIHIRDNLRLGINGEYARRTSEHLAREYERRRIFATLEYGS
jgi:Putative beta-barrel porin 2